MQEEIALNTPVFFAVATGSTLTCTYGVARGLTLNLETEFPTLLGHFMPFTFGLVVYEPYMLLWCIFGSQLS